MVYQTGPSIFPKRTLVAETASETLYKDATWSQTMDCWLPNCFPFVSMRTWHSFSFLLATYRNYWGYFISNRYLVWWCYLPIRIWRVEGTFTIPTPTPDLVGGLVAIFGIFPLILGCQSSQLTHIFQRGGPTTNQWCHFPLDNLLWWLTDYWF